MTGKMPARLASVLLALFLPLAACEDESATLTGDSLVVSPCQDGRTLVLAPVELAFNHVTWLRLSDQDGDLQLRQGYRSPTESNSLLLQFLDLPALLEATRLAPGVPIPMEGLARVTLALDDRCPDATEPLEARAGTIAFTTLELQPSGRIAGTAHFDLRDLRDDPSAPPVGRNLTLTFAKDLTQKDPLTGYGR